MWFTYASFGLTSRQPISNGYTFATYTLAGALGAVLMSIGFDYAGSYRVPLLLFLVATLTAMLLLTRLGPYVYRAR
jgi:cyanate permease